MTSFGNPCGACKFLRRKCARGCCVFAPYFSHDLGATHFAAIHKVFGACNVSKLLMNLPVPDRSEAAVTISYEAQARLQDPIYGCVGHIFALQQQVVNLQAQLVSLKIQTSNSSVNCSTRPDLFQSGDTSEREAEFLTAETNSYLHNGMLQTNSIQSSQSICSNRSTTRHVVQFGVENEPWTSSYRDMEDLQSIAYGYLGH